VFFKYGPPSTSQLLGSC